MTLARAAVAVLLQFLLFHTALVGSGAAPKARKKPATDHHAGHVR